jgi:hypothetical protein
MRGLAAIGLYVSDGDERFANTELGDAFRADAPRPVAGWARFVGRPYHWQTSASLEHSVRTGENVFAAIHGESVWGYLARHPGEQKVFDEAMTALSQAVVDEVCGRRSGSARHRPGAPSQFNEDAVGHGEVVGVKAGEDLAGYRADRCGELFEQGAPIGGEFDGRGCHQAIGPQVVKHRHDVRRSQAELALTGEVVDQLGVSSVR